MKSVQSKRNQNNLLEAQEGINEKVMIRANTDQKVEKSTKFRMN